MTLLERDILAILIAINVVFMILILPNVVPIYFDFTSAPLYVLTFGIGIPLGALGVWANHRAAAVERKAASTPQRRK